MTGLSISGKKQFETMNSEFIPNENDGEVGLVEYKDFVYSKPFRFESSRLLPEIRIRYETYGRLNATKSNAILICHALTGDHHCAGIHSLNDRKPGWWNNIIGPGKPIDTTRFFVICTNVLGGCVGSTGPTSINRETNLPYGMTFPLYTIRDMVAAQALLLDDLGIDSLYAAVGGSMGGMQVLQWGIDFPDRIERLLPMATTGRSGSQAIAFNEVGRSAIMQDPEWQGGNYALGKGPSVGLAIARMMAHITYLSEETFESKFGRKRVENNADAQSLFDTEFTVESYLRYQGRAFVNRFDANTYLYLTKAVDRFDLSDENGRFEPVLERIKGRTLCLGFSTDWLYPPQQNKDLVHALLRCGKNASYAEIEMAGGHDSFLVHAPAIYKIVGDFLLH